jgi:hypothetical protein
MPPPQVTVDTWPTDGDRIYLEVRSIDELGRKPAAALRHRVEAGSRPESGVAELETGVANSFRVSQSEYHLPSYFLYNVLFVSKRRCESVRRNLDG